MKTSCTQLSRLGLIAQALLLKDEHESLKCLLMSSSADKPRSLFSSWKQLTPWSSCSEPGALQIPRSCGSINRCGGGHCDSYLVTEDRLTLCFYSEGFRTRSFEVHSSFIWSQTVWNWLLMQMFKLIKGKCEWNSLCLQEEIETQKQQHDARVMSIRTEEKQKMDKMADDLDQKWRDALR